MNPAVDNAGAKVYTVNGAAAGAGSASSLPDWLTRKRAVKSGRSKRSVREQFEGAVNLIQDFEFPEASNKIKVTRDGHHAIATGVYKPRMKVYDLDQLTLKFERHSDAENVDFLILSDDWTKSVHLQADRTVELHNQGGLYYRTRIPRFGRAIAYHYPSCDTLLAGAGNEIYRLNLEQGRFLAPFTLNNDQGGGTVEGVNAIDINPAHNLLAFATDGPGTVELWDPRSRANVGVLRLPRSLISSTAATSNILPGVDVPGTSLSATALSSRPDGLSLAVGTSTGHTLLYDIRSPKPYATKDQGYGLPIKRVHWIEGGSRMAGDNYIVTADKKVLKVWDRESPHVNFASITTPTDINDVCHIPGSGLFMLANEGIHMTSYYIPQLGPAPKWCSFLDNLTEEMEDQTVRSNYEDFKFIDKTELNALGLDHLLGTPMLKPYMHGYFLSLKLYDAARVITNPFVYAEHREKTIRQKLEKLAESRIRTKKDNLPKVNKALAERIIKNIEREKKKQRRKADDENVDDVDIEMKGVGAKESTTGRLLQDPRFKAVFEDPEFEIDETSREFALLHPSQADATSKRKRTKTAVDEEEESGDGGMSSDDLGIRGGISSEDEDADEGVREDDDSEDMEMVDLRPTHERTDLRSVKPFNTNLKMVSARPNAANGPSTSKRWDPSETFGQRQKSSIPSAKQADSSGSSDIVKLNQDGSATLSFMPGSSNSKGDEPLPNGNGKNKRNRKPGVEYLGAGLERGIEHTEVPESERKGRTQKRIGMRSGSKNAFRGL